MYDWDNPPSTPEELENVIYGLTHTIIYLLREIAARDNMSLVEACRIRRLEAPEEYMAVVLGRIEQVAIKKAEEG